MESRVHSSFPPSCHSIAMVYHLPPLDYRTWHYQKSNIGHIRKTILFLTLSKKLSINFTYEAIASEDRDLHWIVVKRSYIQERNYENHKDHKTLKTIRAKPSWKRLRLSYSRFKLSIFGWNVTTVCRTRLWIQI